MRLVLRNAIIFTLFSLCFGQYYQPKQQDDGQYRPQQEQAYRDDSYHTPTRPPPQIISHKQAQNHDGSFKYAFAAENGLSQGEVIAPDGSRNGGYTYVDPHGKKISVKYTAGKEGFRILEGDHIPKHPGAALAQNQQPQQQQQQHNLYQQKSDDDDGQYRPEKYEQAPVSAPAPIQAPRPHYLGGGSQQATSSYSSSARYTNPTPSYQPPSHAPPQYQPPHYQAQQRLPHYQTQPQPQQYQPQVYTPPQPKYEPRSNQIDEKEPEYHDEPGKAHSFGKGYFFEFGG